MVRYGMEPSTPGMRTPNDTYRDTYNVMYTQCLGLRVKEKGEGEGEGEGEGGYQEELDETTVECRKL